MASSYYTSSATVTWNSWNSQGTASGTSSTWDTWNGQTEALTNTNETWNYWCDTTNLAITSEVDTSNYVWSTWVTVDDCGTTQIESCDVIPHVLGSYGEVFTETKKERKVRQKREKKERLESERRIRLLNEKKEKAESLALSLLGELIGDKELKIYKETGRILVKGNNFDYLLHKHGKVQRYEKDKIVDLCIHFKSKYSYPETDNVIGLKLLAEENDKHFNELANVMRTNNNENIQLPACACGGLLN